MITNDTAATLTAEQIDAELSDLRQFVLAETGHRPTVEAVTRLRRAVAAALAAQPPQATPQDDEREALTALVMRARRDWSGDGEREAETVADVALAAGFRRAPQPRTDTDLRERVEVFRDSQSTENWQQQATRRALDRILAETVSGVVVDPAEVERSALLRAVDAIREHAALFVTMAERMGLGWGSGQQAKHAGYLEAADVVRALATPAPTDAPDEGAGR